MHATSFLLLAAVSLSGCRGGRCCPPGHGTAPTAAPQAQVLFESTLVSGTTAEVTAFLGPAAPPEGRSWRVVPEAEAPRPDAPAPVAGGVRPLALPSVVTADSEEATIEVRDEPTGATWSGVRARASARVAADGSGVVLDYTAVHRGAGEKRAEAAGVTLRTGDVLVLVSAPAADGRQIAALVRTTVLPTP